MTGSHTKNGMNENDYIAQTQVSGDAYMPNITEDSPRMNGEDPNTLGDEDINKSRNIHSESMHVTQEEEGTPQKYFDLSHARAMFMPHKTNTQEPNSLDS